MFTKKKKFCKTRWTDVRKSQFNCHETVKKDIQDFVLVSHSKPFSCKLSVNFFPKANFNPKHQTKHRKIVFVSVYHLLDVKRYTHTHTPTHESTPSIKRMLSIHRRYLTTGNIFTNVRFIYTNFLLCLYNLAISKFVGQFMSRRSEKKPLFFPSAWVNFYSTYRTRRNWMILD